MAYSDESIITALLTTRTKREAAQAIGMQERHFYKRLEDKRLQEKLQAAREQVMQDAMHLLQRGMISAAATLVEIVENKELNPQVRAYASNILFQNGLKVTEQIDILKRLEALENAN